MWRYIFHIIGEDFPLQPIEANSLRLAIEAYRIPYPFGALLLNIEKVS